MKRKFIGNHLRVGQQGQITLPASICRKAHVAEGDWLEAVVEADGSIRLTPVPATVRALAEQFHLEDVDWALQQREKR